MSHIGKQRAWVTMARCVAAQLSSFVPGCSGLGSGRIIRAPAAGSSRWETYDSCLSRTALEGQIGRLGLRQPTKPSDNCAITPDSTWNGTAAERGNQCLRRPARLTGGLAGGPGAMRTEKSNGIHANKA